MRILLQRVTSASVTVEGTVTGAINSGLLLFVGFKESDTLSLLPKAIEKIIGLRIFSDDQGKFSYSVQDIGGEILTVSQFTLYGDCRKGKRPDFAEAMKAAPAKELYEAFNQQLSAALGKQVQAGVFGADMKVSLLNDGPVTLLLEF